MKRESFIVIITGLILTVILGIAFVSSCIFLDYSDPANPNKIPKIVENYLLQKMGNNEQDRYVLVRFRLGNDDFIRDVITDYTLLNNNRNIFYIRNRRSAYFTTCVGFFKLYKNGKEISNEIYDPYMEVSERIEHGTLNDAFETVTKEQLEEILKK